MNKPHNRIPNLPAALAAFADGIAEASWLASIVVVALHFNLHTFTIFEPDKIALFQVLAGMLLAALLLRVSVWRYSGQTTTAAGAAAVIPPAYAGIAGALLISTALSIAPQVSWNGSYLRAHGTLYELCLLAVLVAQCVGLRRHAQVQRLLDTIVLAATVTALYGILQHLGLDPAEWGKSFLADRVSSTQGNPIFLGAYLVLTLPVTIARALQLLRGGSARGRQLAYATLHVVSAAAQLEAIWFTGSRGPWLGLAAGILFMAICQAAAVNNRKVLFALFSLVVAGLLSVLALNMPNGPLETLRDEPYLGRIAHLWDTTNRTEAGTSLRLETWHRAQAALTTTPPLIYADGGIDRWSRLRLLIGYGPETAGFVLAPSYRTEFHNALFSDRAHNILWDTLLATGIIGAAALYLLWASLANKLLLNMGFINSSKSRYGLWTLQITGAAAGLLTIFLLRIPDLAAVAVALGLAAGTLMFPVLSAFLAPRPAQPADVLLTGFAGAALAHFVEAQFGIATVATDLHFIMLAVLIWNWEQLRQPTQEAQPEAKPTAKNIAKRESAAAPARAGAIGAELALPAVLASTTLIFGFLTPGVGINSTAPASVLLLLACAATAAAIALGHAASATQLRAMLVIGLSLPLMYFAWNQLRLNPPSLPETDAILNIAATRSASIYSFAAWVVLVTAGLGLALAIRELPNRNSTPATVVLAPLAGFLALGVALTAIYIGSRSADAHRNLVQAATPAKALALLAEATELAPREDEYWYLHGRTALLAARSQASQGERAGMRAIARASLERALQISPFNPNHLISLARLNFDMAQDTEDPTDRNAIANRSDNYSAAALRLNPHDARWWQNWAVLDYEVFHDYAAAAEKLKRALNEDPTNSRSLVLLGNVSAARALSPQATSSDFDDALSFYTAALVNPVGTSAAEIKLLLGNLWLQRGAASSAASTQSADYKIAADIFEQVISEPLATDATPENDDQPGSAAKFKPWTVHRTLAQLYMSLQQPEPAGKHAALALATAPAAEHELLLQLQAASAAQLLANPHP